MIETHIKNDIFNKINMINNINKKKNKNYKNNTNNNSLNSINNEITLFFNFINGRQVYIDVKGNDIFLNVLINLEKKYSWMGSLQENSFFYKDKEINDKKLTINQLGLVNNSIIISKS